MSHFERTEGAEDNLGNNPDLYIPIDEIKDPFGQSPDEILADKEDGNEDNESIHEIDLDDVDDEPSNWEADVDAGKFDESPVVASGNTVEINPIHTVTRSNISQIEEMKGREQKEKYWDVPSQKIDNSKPKRPEDDRESIRFDEAV